MTLLFTYLPNFSKRITAPLSMRLSLCLILFVSSVVIPVAAYGQATTKIDITSSKAEATDTGINISWKLDRAPDAKEGLKLRVYNGGKTTGSGVDTEYSGGSVVHSYALTALTGKGSIKGKEGDEIFFEIVDSKGKAITGSIVPATKAGSGSSGGTTTGGTGTTGGTTGSTKDCKQDPNKEFQFCNTLFGDNITAPQYVQEMYRWAVGLAVVGASGMIIYAGYKYTTSRGDPSAIGNAKEIIISSLVGLALLILSYTILRFLGVNIATP